MIKNGLRTMIRIFRINISNNSNISYGAKIDSFSIFEGRNIVHRDSIIQKSHIGFASYIGASSFIIKTKIGRFCSIASDVRIICGNHPSKDYVSTHPLFYSTAQFSGLKFVEVSTFEHYSYANSEFDLLCEIGNDVWIGEGARILNGVKIGNGAIIAANAIITRDVKPYSIVAGIPARIIRKRFTESEIEFLEGLKWWDKDLTWMKKNAHKFESISNFIKDDLSDV